MLSWKRGLFGAVLLAPALVVFTVLFAAPQIDLILQSLGNPPPIHLDQYRRFLGDGFYLSMLAQSLLLGICVTLITLVLGFPLAFVLARMNTRWAGPLLILCTLPLWVSAVVRSFAWMVLFFRNGVISRILQSSNLVPADFQLLGTFPGVVIALAQVLLPIMVITLYAVLRSIDRDLEYAALSLGASPLAALWLITLRLARGGILAGSLLVFSLSVSAFATPSMIGGSRAHLMAITIYEQLLELLDWPFAAAIAAILLAISIAAAMTYGFILGDRRLQEPRP